MNRTDAKAIIEAHPHRTLVVRFVKRTTGTLRRMVCVHYPEHAARARFRFNPVAKGLIAVWDLEKGARRFVNLDGVQEIKVSGQRLSPEHTAPQERRANDRPPKPGRTSFEELQAQADELFGY